MEEVTQILVGGHRTGIIGLKEALNEAQDRCEGLSDEDTGSALLEIFSRRNYIPSSITEIYREAFLREYKKHIGEPVDAPASQGLQIKVLGPGCPQCEKLEQEVMAVMAETGVIADLEHVRDLSEIGTYGVMGSPALVIDNQIKAVGSVPSREKLKNWIQEAVNKNNV